MHLDLRMFKTDRNLSLVWSVTLFPSVYDESVSFLTCVSLHSCVWISREVQSNIPQAPASHKIDVFTGLCLNQFHHFISSLESNCDERLAVISRADLMIINMRKSCWTSERSVSLRQQLELCVQSVWVWECVLSPSACIIQETWTNQSEAVWSGDQVMATPTAGVFMVFFFFYEEHYTDKEKNCYNVEQINKKITRREGKKLLQGTRRYIYHIKEKD